MNNEKVREIINKMTPEQRKGIIDRAVAVSKQHELEWVKYLEEEARRSECPDCRDKDAEIARLQADNQSKHDHILALLDQAESWKELNSWYNKVKMTTNRSPEDEIKRLQEYIKRLEIGEEEKEAIQNAICYLEDSEFPSDEEHDIEILRKLLEDT
jgi:hypothetical protein